MIKWNENAAFAFTKEGAAIKIWSNRPMVHSVPQTECPIHKGIKQNRDEEKILAHGALLFLNRLYQSNFLTFL